MQDTGGSYLEDFPAMMTVSLASADAVILGKIDSTTKMNINIINFIIKIDIILNPNYQNM